MKNKRYFTSTLSWIFRADNSLACLASSSSAFQFLWSDADLLLQLLHQLHLLLLLCQLHLDCSNCNCFVTPFVLLLQQRLILIASFNLSAATLLDSAISNCNELAVIHLLLQVTPLLLLFLQPLSIQLTTLARQILVSPWS